MTKHNQKISRIDRPLDPLPIVLRDRIIEMIRQETFIPGQKLPVEPELALSFGVSRGTLREALRLLEEDGFIFRRAGVGTFIRKPHPAVLNSLEKNFGVLEVLQSMDLNPEVIPIETRIIRADQIISDILEETVGSLLLCIQRVIMGNGRKMVHAMNIIPEALVTKNTKDTLQNFRGCLYEFLEKECNQKIGYGIAKLIPTVADNRLSRTLDIDTGSLLLLIEQVTYTVGDKPICLSREYWVKDIVEFTIFRERSGQKLHSLKLERNRSFDRGVKLTKKLT